MLRIKINGSKDTGITSSTKMAPTMRLSLSTFVERALALHPKIRLSP